MKKLFILIVVFACIGLPACQESPQTTAPETAIDAKTSSTEDSSDTANTETDSFIVVLEDYFGYWFTELTPRPSYLKIYEITSDTILFVVYYYKVWGFDATAKLENGKYIFTDEGGDNTGRLEFNCDSVSLILDKTSSEMIPPGKHDFPVRAPTARVKTGLGNLNLRSSPISGELLGKFDNDSIVYLTYWVEPETPENWYHVWGKTITGEYMSGWVSGEYLE